MGDGWEGGKAGDECKSLKALIKGRINNGSEREEGRRGGKGGR